MKLADKLIRALTGFPCKHCIKGWVTLRKYVKPNVLKCDRCSYVEVA